MCQVKAPDVRAGLPGALAYELRVAEAALGRLSLERRRERVIGKPVARIAADLKYVFRQEAKRVIDLLLRQARLPYTPTAEAANIEADAMARLLLNGVDVNQYRAALEDLYRTVGPGAMDQATLNALDKAGVRWRRYPNGDVLLSNGMKLIRPVAAERWVRDNAIVWGRKYAESVSDKTNLMIRNQLAEGMRGFEPIRALADRIEKVYADSVGHRSLMIARTEATRSYAAAQIETGRQLQANGKVWILSGSEYSYVDVCADNEAMGVIPVDALWAHGEVNGPAHPNCQCSESLEFTDDWQIPEQFLEGV